MGKIVAMIPARYAATRFPGKLMQMLGNKTVIRHTYDNTVATGLFDEVWVVFDKDGYTKHEEVFELAKNGAREVKIAFSSIAFEHWALLHFTKCSTAFPKSDCKDEKERVLYCGTGQHINDCHGVRCVAGYMREHNFCPDYAKSGSYYFNHLLGFVDKINKFNY